MANYCGQCGAANDGGAFCSSCGRPLEAAGPPHAHPPAEPTMVSPPQQQAPAAPPAAPPAAHPQAPQPPQEQLNPTAQFPTVPPQGPPPGPPQGYAPQPGYPQQGYPQQAYPQQGYPQQGYAPPGYAAPAAPKVNPFVGWPISDYVRDAVAAFAFFACLGMPWDLNDEAGFGLEVFNHGGERWWVVIAALLGVVSLAVPYLAKAHVVPGWGPQHYRLTRLALNAPMALSVVAALILELVNIGEDTAGGLGSAIGMALAGVALAVQPRAAEETPGHQEDRLWGRIASITTLAATGVTVLLFVLWFLHGVVDDSNADIFDPFTTGFLAPLFVFLLMPLALVGYPTFQYLMAAKDDAWRRVLATSGFTVLAVALLALASDHQGLFFWPEVEKWNGYFGGFLPGGGILLLGAAAAFAISRTQQRATAGATADPVAGWLATVPATLQLAAAGSALTVLTLILIMIEEDFRAGPIVVVVLLLAAAGGAGFGLTLVGDPRKNRVVLLGILGGVAVIGLIALGILNGEDLTVVNTGYAVAAWVTLPLLGAYALTVPPEVRSALGPLVQGGAGQAPRYGGPPQGPPPYGQQPGYPQPGLQQPGLQQPGHPPQAPAPGYPPQQPPQQMPPPQGPPMPGPPVPPQPGGWGPPPSA